jgi:hypothetical protein
MHRDLDPQTPLGQLLRELPAEAARPYDFGEFRRRAHARAAPAPRALGASAFAAAAVIALAAGALWMRFGTAVPPPGSAPSGADAVPGALRAAAMERWLASLPSEPAVVHVGTHAAVAGLEDRIAQVDDLMTTERVGPAQPARLLALQQERTRLIGTLVQVRYAEALAAESE